MHSYRWLSDITRETSILLFFLLLFSVSLLGLKLPQPPLKLRVGSIQAAAFASGISLYAPLYSNHFYSFSPLDDYIIMNDGRRLVLLPLEDYQKHNYRAWYASKSLDLYVQFLRSFFIQPQLEYHVTTAVATTHYTLQQENTTLTLTKNYEGGDHTNWKQVGTAIKLHPQDTLTTAEGNIIDTTPTASRSALSTTKVKITNPNLPAQLIVIRNENQNFYYHPDFLLLEIEENVTSNLPTTLKIEVEPS